MKKLTLSLALIVAIVESTHAQSAAIHLCDNCTYIDRAHNRTITFNLDGSMLMNGKPMAGYKCANVDGVIGVTRNGLMSDPYHWNSGASKPQCRLFDKDGNCFELQVCRPSPGLVTNLEINGAKLGMSMSDFMKRFPKAEMTNEEGVGELYTVNDPSGFDLFYATRDERDRISIIIGCSPNLATSEGIGVGTTLQDLLAKYHVSSISELNEETPSSFDLTITVKEYPKLKFDLLVDKEIWNKVKNGKIALSAIPKSTRIENVVLM